MCVFVCLLQFSRRVFGYLRSRDESRTDSDFVIVVKCRLMWVCSASGEILLK